MPRSRAIGWAYRALLAALLLLLVHAIAINVFLLSGSLDRLLLGKTRGVVNLHTAASFSLLPGVVHLRGMRLEVIDSNVHLEILVPRGRTHVRLSGLLGKQFATHSIVGERLVIRVRPNFESLPESRSAALPPLSDKEEKGPPSEPGKLWGIDLAGIDARFDELWISELRYRGVATVEGGFQLLPLESLEIHPSHVLLDGGQLTYGPKQRVLSLERASFEARLPETPAPELAQRWRERIAVALDVAGKVEGVQFAEALSPRLAGLSGGQGELRVLARAEGGRWSDDLKVSYATDSLAYADGAKSAQVSIHVAMHASANDETIGADVGIDSFALSHEGERLASLEDASVRGGFDRRFPIPAPEDARLTVRELMLAGLAPLAAFELLPKGMRPEGGKVVVQADLRWRDDRVTGQARADLRGVELSYGDWFSSQNGQLDLIGLSWRVSQRRGQLGRTALKLDQVRLRHPDASVDDWHFELACDDLRFSSGQDELHGSFVTRSHDAKPALMLMGVRGLPPGVDEFLAMPDLRVHGELALSGGTQEVRIQRADSDTIDVRGRFVRQNGENHAAVLFTARPLSLGVTVDRKDSGFKLFASDAWLTSELARLPPREGPRGRTGQLPRRSAPTEATSLSAKPARTSVPE